MIDREHLLEPVQGLAPLHVHEPSIVDQHIELRRPPDQPLGCPLDRVQRRQIDLDHFGLGTQRLQLGDQGRTLIGAAAQQHRSLAPLRPSASACRPADLALVGPVIRHADLARHAPIRHHTPKRPCAGA